MAGPGGRVVSLTFGFASVANFHPVAVKRFSGIQRNFSPRLDEFKRIAIRLLLQELKGFVADGVTLPAFHAVIVVIEDFFERPLVNNGLIAFEALALLAFEGFDGD